MRTLLITLDSLAMLAILGMSDVDWSRRILVLGVLVINLLLLGITRTKISRVLALGMTTAACGYAGSVISWLVLFVGCGAERFNATCDAIVNPVIMVLLVVSLSSVPLSNVLAAVLARRSSRT